MENPAFQGGRLLSETYYMGKKSNRCFCAFCRSERSVYRKRHVSAVDVLWALIASVLLSFIFWQDFDPRLVAFFAVGVAIAETFVIIRRKSSIACPRCGFDPVLYRRSPELAAARVKQYYKEKAEDPMSVFSPPAKLPVIVRKAERRAL
ncbi:MAG: hypothetical protein EOP05_08650 [Proteobacteria bacterium]|nr:MAG: hypothetical protein EOP05_08650 [Pseudomonadota bacterium]